MNYCEWFAAHVLHSFCIHCIKFLTRDQMMDFICHMPLISVELTPLPPQNLRHPRRITSFDALAITHYASALRAISLVTLS